jgi:hypothetical protein
MAAFRAVFIFGGSGPTITAHGSLDLKQEIQIQIQTWQVKILKGECLKKLIHTPGNIQFIQPTDINLQYWIYKEYTSNPQFYVHTHVEMYTCSNKLT